MTDLFSSCEKYIGSDSQTLNKESLIIRGAWRVQYALRLTEKDFPVLREFILIQTRGFGSCHYEPGALQVPIVDCVGLDASRLQEYPLPYKIAALDAVASDLVGLPDDEYVLDGDNIQKIEDRTDIIYREAKRLTSNIISAQNRKANVLVVGALGSIVSRLTSDTSLNVCATDSDPTVSGKNYHGIVIKDGKETIEGILETDIAIVTGMTLTNGTINNILSVAGSRGIPILMFLQTGANLIHPYLEAGVNVVVSEPYPFYFMSSGKSIIRIYRSRMVH